jgi:hypothetical protein
MSTTIINKPEEVINNNFSTVSKWNATHHPIKFGLKREDYEVSVVTLGGLGAPLEVTITSGLTGNASDFFTPGKFIYLFIGLGANPGSGNFEILSITDPNTIILLNPDFLVLGGTGYINDLERANFFIKTDVYDKSSGTNVFVQSSINKPDATGFIEVDVSSFLKSLVGYIDEYNYVSINKKDLTLGGIFNIEFNENWVGNTGSINVPGEDFYFTNSSKQIGDRYGSNMGAYVPFQNYTTGDRAKFMTDFKIPTHFPNFPHSLTFINGDEMTGFPRIFQENFDLNKNFVSGSNTALDISANAKPFVNRLLIDITDPTIKFSDFFINAFPVQVTESLRMKVDHECKDFPIYLTWLNSVGGYDYWLFFKKNKYKIQTKLENSHVKNIENLETAIGNIDISGKGIQPQIDFGARVRAEDMDGMAGLFGSPKVLYLTNPEGWQLEGPKWNRVIIKPGSLLVSESNFEFLEIKMSMLLPTLNTQKE